MGNQTVTLDAIAKVAQVSPKTVSRVLNEEPYVRESVRERVLEVAEAMGYVPNAFAKGLASQKSSVVGFIAPTRFYSNFAPTIRAVGDELDKNGYDLVIADSGFSPTKKMRQINFFRQYRSAGLIIAPSRPQSEYIVELSKTDTPFVCLSQLDSVGADFVAFDDLSGAHDAMQYLVDIGHVRIGCISGGPLDEYPQRYKLEGYKRTLMGNRIAIDHSIMIEMPDSTCEYGRDAAEKFMVLKNKPTAVFSFSDVTAIGFMQRIREYGLIVPEDVAVVGFGDIEFSALLDVPLTTMKLPKTELGKIAASMLLNRIDGERIDGYQQALLKPELVVRKSSGEANGGNGNR